MDNTQLFRETIPFVARGRGILYSCLMAAGFIGLWHVVDGNRGHFSPWVFFLAAAGFTSVIFFASRTQLRTTVDSSGISIEFWPFGGRRLLSPIDLGIVTIGGFNPLVDNDGWGIVRAVRPSHAWGTSALKGVWLHRKSGASLFVPSQRPEELAHAVQCLL